ncbi:pyroglutamyl-peptidase I, partial [Staphylococcus aureus]|nr:pyroglutamyl-peptidase I [Staphylococcus aureus]
IADNEGNQPIDEVIQVDGNAAYFSNLPVKRITEAIKAQGIPSRLSNTAGTFVCNHILYQLGYLQATAF